MLVVTAWSSPEAQQWERPAPSTQGVSGRAAMCFQAGALLSSPSGWPCPSLGPPAELSGPQTPPGAPPRPGAVTWCRSTCCYCGCAGASPRAVGEAERVEKSGGQAAGRGRCPPPSRAQGPHLGGAGQELLLLPGRCHRGDEAQRGQVLPFLLEKKWKVVKNTSKGHSLPHWRAFQSRLLPLGKILTP